MKNIYELYGSEDLSEHYYYKDELSRGRPEVCSDGRFNPVCDVSWDLQDASVVCRTLGFSPYGKHGLYRNVQYSGCYTSLYFKGAIADRSGLYSPIELDDVTEWNMLHCDGTEATITECLITSTEHCPSNEVASAICQSKFIFCECDSSESNTVYSHALKVHLLSMATVAMAR